MRSIVEEKRQELKKGKSFDFLEERERDKNEIVPRLLEDDPCPFQTEFFSSWNSQALYYAFQHMEEKKICDFLKIIMIFIVALFEIADYKN